MHVWVAHIVKSSQKPNHLPIMIYPLTTHNPQSKSISTHPSIDIPSHNIPVTPPQTPPQNKNPTYLTTPEPNQSDKTGG